MRRYYVADRNRNKLRALLDWQATEALSLQGGAGLQQGRLPRRDLRPAGHQELGRQPRRHLRAGRRRQRQRVLHLRGLSARSRAGNTYTANSNVATITGGQPERSACPATPATATRRCSSGTTTTSWIRASNWSANMLDKVHTVGFALREEGRASWTLTGNFDPDPGALGQQRHRRQLGQQPPRRLRARPPTTIAAFFIPATPLPTVTTDTLELRLNGTYAIDAHQSVRVVYAYMRMRSADWAYEGMQIGAGTLSSVLPTNETAVQLQRERHRRVVPHRVLDHPGGIVCRARYSRSHSSECCVVTLDWCVGLPRWASDLAKGDAAKGKATYAERKCGHVSPDRQGGRQGRQDVHHPRRHRRQAVAGRHQELADRHREDGGQAAKKPPMPMSGFMKNLKPALSDAEVANLVAYMQTLSGGKPNP